MLQVLLVNVEISDQMGTSETFLVGLFDNEEKMVAAKDAADLHFRTRRTSFTAITVNLNTPVPLKEKWKP